MSNIIKGTRIRSKTVLDLSDRIRESPIIEESVGEIFLNEDIEQKQEELLALDLEIQRRIEKVQEEADQILREAQEKAQYIREEAAAQKDTILGEAYTKQENILQEAQAQAMQITESAYEEKKQYLLGIEPEVVETLTYLLQHIISEELSFSPSWIAMIVRKMLSKDEVSGMTTLMVSPYNLERLEEANLQLKEGISRLVAVESKDTLNDTTCVLVTKQGNIEYDVSQGLETVLREVRILQHLSEEHV